jgi:hypothetical protein
MLLERYLLATHHGQTTVTDNNSMFAGIEDTG